MRQFLAASTLLFSLGCTSPQSPDVERDVTKLHAKVEQSLVYLQFWTAGAEGKAEIAGHGTGFIIADANKRRWILTAAHGLEPSKTGNRVTCAKYRLKSQSIFAECHEAIVDQKHDIAVLSPDPQYPLNATPLEFATDSQSIPKALYASGSASGLNMQTYPGSYVAEVMTAKEWANRQVADPTVFAPLSLDTTFVRHGIPIADGYSGCPILTKEGKVVGVQSRAFDKARFHAFAIHYKHVLTFDWRKPPLKLVSLDLAKSNADRLLARTNNAPAIPFHTETGPSNVSSTMLPVTIKLGGVNVEAPLIHHGYVEDDAWTVIDKYIQDKQWYFIEQFGGLRILRLQQLLNRKRLARISNPVLGFQMLVPEGYLYSAQATDHPDGMLVTFAPEDDDGKRGKGQWPISLWVRVESDMFKRARADVVTKMANGKMPVLEIEKASPFLLAAARERYIAAEVGDVVEPRFVKQSLKLKLKKPAKDGSQRPNALSAIEEFEQFLYTNDKWFRTNYISTTTDAMHIVRFGSRDPVVLLVHSQFSKAGVAEFNSLDATPDPKLSEFLIFLSSFSLQ